MKTYKNIQSVRQQINKTLLKYVDYTIVNIDGRFTAKFNCLSDLEKKTVIKQGFVVAREQF